MSACEECWAAAFHWSRIKGTHQADEYRYLLRQMEGQDDPHGHGPREVNDADAPDFMPRTSPYVKPVKRLAAPTVTRDELAAHLDSVFHGDNWDEIAEEIVLFFDVRHRPEGSDTDG